MDFERSNDPCSPEFTDFTPLSQTRAEDLAKTIIICSERSSAAVALSLTRKLFDQNDSS